MGVDTTRKRSKTNWKRVDSMDDRRINYSEIPELGANCSRERFAGLARKSKLRYVSIPTHSLSFASMAKVTRPPSTLCSGNMWTARRVGRVRSDNKNSALVDMSSWDSLGNSAQDLIEHGVRKRSVLPGVNTQTVRGAQQNHFVSDRNSGEPGHVGQR